MYFYVLKYMLPILFCENYEKCHDTILMVFLIIISSRITQIGLFLFLTILKLVELHMVGVVVSVFNQIC